MIDDMLLGLGLVAIVEGLVLSVSPGRLDRALEALRTLGPDHMRFIGLGAVAVGVALVWVARG
jgi:uncharacterized protein